MKLKTVLLAGAAVIVLSGNARADELRGTYFALEGGASFVGNERFFQSFLYTTGASSVTDVRVSFNTGWSVFGSAGYGFGDGWRAELEAGYRFNDIDRQVTSGGATTPTGDLSEFTLMANILFDLEISDSISLSIGAGAGADHAHFDAGTNNFDDDDWAFAYQGLLGLNYALTPRTQLFLNYRYMRVDTPEYSKDFAGAPGFMQNVSFHRDLDKQAVTLGFRFALDGAAPPPAPPPAAPPPPPAPVPTAPKEFIVFFGYDKSELSPEAERVVSDAAYAAHEWGSASITIVGHTDSMGSNSYNQALSLRRANAVRASLAAQGIPADTISAVGKGESELLVRTGDAVKEPQNRRATINLE